MAIPSVNAAQNQIVWNGQRVSFRVFRGTEEITHTRDWRRHAQVFYNGLHPQPTSHDPARKYQRTEITLNGDFSHITETAPVVNPFHGSTIQQITIEKTPLAKTDGRLANISNLLNLVGSQRPDEFTQAAPLPSSAPTPLPGAHPHLYDIAGNGRCGPASLVDQMCRLVPEWNHPTPEQQQNREHLLRSLAAQNMVHNAPLRSDPHFRLHIFEAFQTMNEIPDRITDPAIAAIATKYKDANPTAETIHHVPQDEMDQLINYYAAAVTGPNFWIDFAFIYAIKYVPADGPLKEQLPPLFQNGIQTVVLEQDPMRVLHNATENIADPNNLFIWFDRGQGHYKSVKRNSTQLVPALQQFYQAEMQAAHQKAAIQLREQSVERLRAFAHFNTSGMNDEARIAAATSLVALLQNLGEEHVRDYGMFLGQIKPNEVPNNLLTQFQAANLPMIQTFLSIYLRAHFPLAPPPPAPGTPAPPPSPFLNMDLKQLLTIDPTAINRESREQLLNQILKKLYERDPALLIVYAQILFFLPQVATLRTDQTQLFNFQITNLAMIQRVLTEQLGI